MGRGVRELPTHYNYGRTGYLKTFATSGFTVVWTRDTVTSTEPSNEEVYHRTSFRVATINGTSDWTRFQQPDPVCGQRLPWR